MSDDPLLPLHIVARRLCRSRDTVQRWCRERTIECVSINGRYRIRESVVMQKLEAYPVDSCDSMVARED